MNADRRKFLWAAALGGVAAGWPRPWLPAATAGEFVFRPDHQLVPAPDEPRQWPAFRAQLAQWRAQTRRELSYDDALYGRSEFAWAASSFCCCFVMLYDESFFDRRRGEYTVEEFLAHGQREFGGYDSAVLWHAYPRIGADQRNQFDFYRDMPGGLTGLGDAVARMQRLGTRVYIDYNPWDTGTRREGAGDADALVDIVRALQADGVFLDTMSEGSAELRAKLDAVRPGVVLEGEAALPLDRLHDHHASWAQQFADSQAPGVLRHKWLERRHMQHQVCRWRFDHTGELHAAWMNGSGTMVWENVFGAWVGWSARDRSLLRAMLPIQRRFAPVFAGEAWTPLVPTEAAGVYASRWEVPGLRLWTLVNRRDEAASGPLLRTNATAGAQCFDLIAGREVTPRADGGRWLWEGTLAPRGLGCFLAAPRELLGADFAAFLAGQAATLARADADASHRPRETRLVPLVPTEKRHSPPAGMVAVAAPANVELSIQMRVRECGFYDSITPDEQGFGDSYRFAVREFRRAAAGGPFAIDETPVTNAQFRDFLAATDYRPQHATNFLRHWNDGRPPAGQEDHPVVWVDLDDARAYARWAGKRLPTEEEWQLAAQGADGRTWPWGNELQPGRCNLGATGATTPVRTFPYGRSPCGCYDLCGNVWQWTESERSDGRTRFAILRGGSYFAARGSNWYLDGGPRPANYATKFLLLWPGLDRCATIGFRCAVDLG